jgi:hypothetical protein
MEMLPPIVRGEACGFGPSDALTQIKTPIFKTPILLARHPGAGRDPAFNASQAGSRPAPG